VAGVARASWPELLWLPAIDCGLKLSRRASSQFTNLDCSGADNHKGFRDLENHSRDVAAADA